MNKIHRISSLIKQPLLFNLRQLSSKPTTNKAGAGAGDDEWNDAWETAWLPEDLSAKNRSPWEADVNFSISSDNNIPAEIDPETKAFVEDMTDNWDQRRKMSPKKTKKAEQERILEHQQQQQKKKDELSSSSGGSLLYSLERVKKDYRLKKQRVHAGLWMKEIEKMDESKLADSVLGGGRGCDDDIERLLDSASEIFDTTNNDVNNCSTLNSSELKNKPDGWETTSKGQDGNIWEMSQREEDILLQEFERRIAFCKFQIASFIKTHIFSRRRPIDGWKYMIEEIGPNARRGKGSVARLPSVSDPATQPFKEEKIPNAGAFPSKRR